MTVKRGNNVLIKKSRIGHISIWWDHYHCGSLWCLFKKTISTCYPFQFNYVTLLFYFWLLHNCCILMLLFSSRVALRFPTLVSWPVSRSKLAPKYFNHTQYSPFLQFFPLCCTDWRHPVRVNDSGHHNANPLLSWEFAGVDLSLMLPLSVCLGMSSTFVHFFLTPFPHLTAHVSLRLVTLIRVQLVIFCHICKCYCTLWICHCSWISRKSQIETKSQYRS